MTKPIRPMLCGVIEKPFDSPNHLFEAKFDGIRCIAVFDNAILDGEIVCLGEDGMPDFNRQQNRTNLQDPVKIAQRMKTFPVTYEVFDVLEINGQNIMHLDLYPDRKMLLTDIMQVLEGTPRLYSRSGKEMTATFPDIQDRITEAGYVIKRGIELFELMKKAEGEGIIAKPLRSHYKENDRNAWFKIKLWHEGVFLACGVTAGKNGRTGKLGALVLGKWENGEMVYHGEAGSGLNDNDVENLPKLLTRSSACPFKVKPKIQDLDSWLIPDLELEIQYAKITESGRLIFPSIRNIRRK